MVDANQKWDVQEAIDWMKSLSLVKPLWIEEPTSPDDILGHAKIAEELKSYGIGVATGEMCANRVMFKQMFQAKALQFCQIDSARIGGVNEILSVYLMAYKFNGNIFIILFKITKVYISIIAVPVCPHAGGIGLCEMVQHLQMWDYICLSGTTENRIIEYVDQQHEHFEDPVVVKNACYQTPSLPGYSSKLKDSSLADFNYPSGTEWQRLIKEKLFSQSV